jgi:hypothetical protein
MFYKEKVAICSTMRTKHINKLCGQDVEFLNGVTVRLLMLVLRPIKLYL